MQLRTIVFSSVMFLPTLVSAQTMTTAGAAPPPTDTELAVQQARVFAEQAKLSEMYRNRREADWAEYSEPLWKFPKENK